MEDLIVLEGVLRRRGDVWHRWKRVVVLIALDHLYGFNGADERISFDRPSIDIDLLSVHRVATSDRAHNEECSVADIPGICHSSLTFSSI
jgi:hypothetical protein